MFDYKLELVSASKRSVVVVVAPLVALMVDQVQSLRAKGVEAAIVSSGGREGRVAGDLLASDFQSLISSSLALIEVSVELCQGTRQIPHWGHSMLFQPPSHIDHLGLCSKIYYWLLWIPNERIPSYSVQLKLIWKLQPFKIWVPRPLFDNLFKRWRL